MNNPLAARPKPASVATTTKTTDITKPPGLPAKQATIVGGGEESKEEESKEQNGKPAAARSTSEGSADSGDEE